MSKVQFHPITLADKGTIESYTRGCAAKNCDLSFANIYCWQTLYCSECAVVEGFLVIRFLLEGSGEMGYMQPIGGGGELDFSPILPQLQEEATARGERLIMIGLTDEGRETIESYANGEFSLHSDPSKEDYIYSRESLATLSGKRLQPKRNHVNQFQRRHEGYEYRPIGRQDFEACLHLDCLWRAERGDCSCHENSPERRAMLRAFEHFEELELRGGALFVEGQMVAFTYGSIVCRDTFCVHSEKGLSAFAGCYPVINQLFAQTLPEHIEYINREEDMGIEGLRRAKLSYYPLHLQPKFTAIALSPEERDLRELWHTVFGDDYDFIDNYLQNHHSSGQLISESSESGDLISMLHLIPFSCEMGGVAYLYAVATHPDYRGNGAASRLIERAKERAREWGMRAIMLIPGEESLMEYYRRLDFEESVALDFESHNNFDFGGEEGTPHRSMIHWIGERGEAPTATSILLSREYELPPHR